jgi:DNA-binding transcriptional LysR family regulator
MELREVRSFVILAEQLHFGRAARLLHLSQPALTKQMHRLEEAVGGALLLRGKHGAQLTSLGRFFLEGARELVRESDGLLALTQRMARGEGGRLRIGFGFHTFDLVPRIIVRLRKSQPNISISLKDMSTSEQIEELQSEKMDLGFIRASPVKGLEVLPVIEDRVMLVTSGEASHPVALDLATLRQEPFVLISHKRSPTFHSHVLRICAHHGFHPRVVQEVPEITTALALVRAGLGASMVPASFCTNRFSGVRFHPIAGPMAAWSVAAAWRKGDPNPLIARFIALLQAEMKIRPAKGSSATKKSPPGRAGSPIRKR